MCSNSPKPISNDIRNSSEASLRELEAGLSITKQALAGKHVFLTGATGFLGKVILEKILRCLDVASITLLIREDATLTAHDRFLNQIVPSAIFDKLRRNWHDAEVRCVAGNVSEDRLGINDTDYERLSRLCDVIIHSAGNVDFMARLDDSLQTNTLALHHLADLAEVSHAHIVHISTCYVNGFNQGRIPERVSVPKTNKISKEREANKYMIFDVNPAITDIQENIDKAKAATDSTCATDEEAAAILRDLGASEAQEYGFGNVYSLTKWLGEQVLLNRFEVLKESSLTIIRPSIIESCWKDPIPGWIEGVKVMDTFLLMYARGKVHYFPARAKGILDIIPADMVANSIILSAAEALLKPACDKRHASNTRSRIYQICSGDRNPLSLRKLNRYVIPEIRKNPTMYKNMTKGNKPRSQFRFIPPKLFKTGLKYLKWGVTMWDTVRKRAGKESTSKTSIQLAATLKLVSFYSLYTSPRYVFTNHNLLDLASRMDDRDLFPVDAALIDWKDYLRTVHLPGFDRYGLSKKPEDSLKVCEQSLTASSEDSRKSYGPVET